MTMFLGNPELELRIYGEEYQDDYNYIDEYGDEYEYDEFIGKWIRKRKERRASKPKVIARRKKRDEKRVLKGKEAKYPHLVSPPPPREEVVKEPEVKEVKSPTASNLIPLTKNEAQVHKNVNKAIQEELKTKQEELKTIGLEKQVEQEEAKTEQIKGQTQMASTGKGMMWIVGLVGAAVVLKLVFGGKKDAPPVKQVAAPVTA